MTRWICAFDPSITSTGVAWPDGSLSHVGGDAKMGDARLDHIAAVTRQAADGCSLAVIEDLPQHGKAAGITGMAQGVIRLELRRMAVPYALVTAASLKMYATGKGNADKPTMRMELYKRAGQDVAQPDECDALWLRMMGLDHLGCPEFVMPQANRAAMVKVKWPT